MPRYKKPYKTSPFDRTKHGGTRKFSTFLHPLLYNKKNRKAVTIAGDKDGPIKKTDDCWVTFAVAAILFECSRQTIRILWADGKVRAVQYPGTPCLVYLPDVQFWAWDKDDDALLSDT